MAKIGRPKLEETRDLQIKFYVTRTEYDLLVAAAAEQRHELAPWVRAVALREADKLVDVLPLALQAASAKKGRK